MIGPAIAPRWIFVTFEFATLRAAALTVWVHYLIVQILPNLKNPKNPMVAVVS
jgi:amino acid permease